MAFLDNSGDIILDAVLTETGRRRMSDGRFRIVKFAFGDDEINYELYNKNHASGSAYYDLEIMQTPVFEASTGEDAEINYGLMSLANNNLLYMPTIKRNQLVKDSTIPVSNVYYVAVDDASTYDALVTAYGGINGGGVRRVLRSGKTDGSYIVLETGLDTTELAPTQTNRNNFINANGLVESGFQVSVDRRFILGVLGPGGGSIFSNGGTNGEANISINLVNNPTTIRDRQYRNNRIASVGAIANSVFRDLTNTISDTSISVIAGPRGSVTALGFVLKQLTPDDYTRYGKTGQSIVGAAGTYRYIDTTVRVAGSTGITEQLAIRIIEKE